MPERRPLLALLLAAVLGAAALAGLEGFWRVRGHRPTVVDDANLWCQQRRRVEGADEIALVGASRILLGSSLSRYRERLPGREPIQLAVGGMYPVATLRDLAADERFRGIAIVSLIARALEPHHWEDQEGWVRTCRDAWNLERRVGRSLRTALEQRLVVVMPWVGLREVGESLASTGRLPPPWWVFRFPDRSGYVDFELRRRTLGGDRLVRSRYDPAEISPPARWLETALGIEPWIRAIEARGGRVALVRFPTSGREWENDERFYPRALYWDALADRTRAVTLHFRDEPVLAAFPLPDESHLGRTDIPPFTDALIDALARRGLFAD